jgi:hypothetical protein
MNLAGAPRHRSWGHVFTSQRVEEEQQAWPPAGEGRVDPRGASLAAANRDPAGAMDVAGVDRVVVSAGSD